MILLNFEWNIPKIKYNKHQTYKTLTVNLGFCKLMWFNQSATQGFMTVSGLVLTDYDRVMNYEKYEHEIELLHEQLANVTAN